MPSLFGSYEIGDADALTEAPNSGMPGFASCLMMLELPVREPGFVSAVASATYCR